jgi:hypothetical protein
MQGSCQRPDEKPRSRPDLIDLALLLLLIAFGMLLFASVTGMIQL